MVFHPKIFSGLFSATFCSFLPFCGLQFSPAMKNFLPPLLSYLAENSAIWQQWRGVKGMVSRDWQGHTAGTNYLFHQSIKNMNFDRKIFFSI
jgi:hypothetical protein